MLFIFNNYLEMKINCIYIHAYIYIIIIYSLAPK